MDLKFFTLLAGGTSDISELIPVIIYLKYVFKKQPYMILGNYFILSASIKVLTLVTALMIIHNMPAYHLLVIIEAVFLYVFYARIIYNSQPQIWIIAILILLNVLNSLFYESIYQFNSVGWTFCIIFLLCLGLRYLYKLY